MAIPGDAAEAAAAVKVGPVSIAAPREETALLQTLGLLPIWMSSRADPHGLVEAYRRATDWGQRLALGDDDQPLGRLGRLGLRKVAPDGRIRAAAEIWCDGRGPPGEAHGSSQGGASEARASAARAPG